MSEQLEYTAAELMRLYREEKRHRIGRRYVLHPRFQNPKIWEHAAELCIEVGAEPKEFIQAAFDGCKIKEGPMPNLLSSKRSMGRWWQEWSSARPVAGDTCGSHIAKLSEMIAGDEHWRLKAATAEALQILQDPRESFPDWFRVVVRPEDHRIWNEFGWVAVKQLLQQPRLINELREKQFDVDLILNHDDLPKPPIWVEQLAESGIDIEKYEY